MAAPKPETTPKAKAKAKTKKAGIPSTLLITALAAAPLIAAPPVIRGLSAGAWVEHYAAMENLPRPRRAVARAVIDKADTAIRNLAPLPQAANAAIRALELGQRIEQQGRDKDAALLIYQGIRASAARARDRAFAGPGFAVIEARAAALEEAATRPQSKPATASKPGAAPKQ